MRRTRNLCKGAAERKTWKGQATFHFSQAFYYPGPMCTLVKIQLLSSQWSTHLDWHKCMQLAECGSVANMLTLAVYKLSHAFASYFNLYPHRPAPGGSLRAALRIFKSVLMSMKPVDMVLLKHNWSKITCCHGTLTALCVESSVPHNWIRYAICSDILFCPVGAKFGDFGWFQKLLANWMTWGKKKQNKNWLWQFPVHWFGKKSEFVIVLFAFWL